MQQAVICYFPAPNCDQTAKNVSFSQNTVSLAHFLGFTQTKTAQPLHWCHGVIHCFSKEQAANDSQAMMRLCLKIKSILKMSCRNIVSPFFSFFFFSCLVSCNTRAEFNKKNQLYLPINLWHWHLFILLNLFLARLAPQNSASCFYRRLRKKTFILEMLKGLQSRSSLY